MSWVLVLGDVFLDRWTTGTVSRCSPEAPVPVLVATQTIEAPGGAGNVAMNLSSLGIRTRYFGRRVDCHDCPDSERICRMLAIHGVDMRAGYASKVPPEVKHRYASGQQLLRVDTTYPKLYDPPEVQAEYVRSLHHLLHEQPSAVVVSDYGKGTLDGLRNVISNLCESYKLPLYVDTKPEYLKEYGSVFMLKPNLREAAAMAGPVLHPALETDDPVQHGIVYGREILRTHPQISAVCVTLGAAGSVLLAGDWDSSTDASHHQVADVTGAGDTFLATLVAGVVAGHGVCEAARRATLAGAMAVSRYGTVTIGGDELEDLVLGLKGDAGKLMNDAEVAKYAARQHRKGKRIGFTNGCFDLMHPGHVYLLQQARSRCDVLIVAANSDASISRLKGPGRPVGDASLRRPLLLPLVDALVEFDDDTPLDIIKAIHPQFLFKGDEYIDQNVVGADFVAARGGEVVFIPMLPNFSTTQIAEVLSGRGSTV